MLHPILRVILHMQHFSFGTPDRASALRAAYEVLLVVHAAEERVAADTREKDTYGVRRWQHDGVSGEVLRLQGVHAWQPDHGAPGEVKAKVVMADIDGTEVPIFVDKEVDHIDRLQDRADNDGVGYDAMELALVGDKGEIYQCPSNDAGSAVVEELEVEILS